MAGVTPDPKSSPSSKVTASSLASRLTSWEKDQLESIHVLLEKAISNKDYFEEKDKNLSSDGTGGMLNRAKPCETADWIKFRETMFDLYSVLDYTYFLLYCHFSNGGQPDHSHDNAMKCGFPFKFKGVPTCLEDPDCSQDKQDDFKGEKIEFLFKGKLKEGTHFCRDIIERILAVQPKKIVSKSGAEIKKDIPDGDGESLALLHYFRNCSTHRSLIYFTSKEVWIEFDQITGEVRFVPTEEKKDDKNDKFYYYQDKALKGYILHLPEGLAVKKDRCRLLPVVLDRLVTFVKNFSKTLLSAALLLDSSSIIQLDPSINPFPPQITLKAKHVLMLRNEFKQQIATKTQNCVEVRDEPLNIVPVEGKPQYFKGSYKLTIVKDGKELIALSSNEHETRGKDKVKEMAVQEVIEECIRLGLIIVTN